MSAEQRFDYPGGVVAFQRPCDTPGCQGGLLLSPARFDPRCDGLGYLVRWERDGVEVGGPW